MNKTEDPRQSPCIRNCCLNEVDVCFGCYRSLDEIISWSQANDDQRRTILLNAKQRQEKADG